MKRAIILSLVLGLIVIFGLNIAEAATTNLYLTIEPNPLLEFLNNIEDTMIFSGNEDGTYYFLDSSNNQLLEIITGETRAATLKLSISGEGALILTIL